MSNNKPSTPECVWEEAWEITDQLQRHAIEAGYRYVAASAYTALQAELERVKGELDEARTQVTHLRTIMSEWESFLSSIDPIPGVAIRKLIAERDALRAILEIKLKIIFAMEACLLERGVVFDFDKLKAVDPRDLR